MNIFRNVLFAALVGAWSAAALAADDVMDAIDQARKAYQSGDLASAKQSLDLASQLIGQKNAESFAALLPNALGGWKAEKAQITAIGAGGFGASTASRRYTNGKGDDIEVQITGDSAMIMQFATILANPQIAGTMGKIVRVGSQRAVQNAEGDVYMVISNKFLVIVQGSGAANDKIAYAQAVDVGRLSKM
jgi:NAD-dependent DNA ligase